MTAQRISLGWLKGVLKDMAKIKLDSKLLSRAKKISEAAGYSSVEEFVTHIIEKELAKSESNEVDDKVADRLRGLGYIE
jgi:hypothetical protein